jgi:hypothetical protein
LTFALDKEDAVKSFIAIAALAGCILVFSACDSGGDGTLESCATSLLGTFEGAKTGPITAQLKFDGTLSTIFVPDGEATRDATVTVSADSGEITPGAGVLQLTGSIDFNTCEGNGDWTLFGTDSGTWHLEMRRPASF